jgi:hypothetical protein
MIIIDALIIAYAFMIIISGAVVLLALIGAVLLVVGLIKLLKR